MVICLHGKVHQCILFIMRIEKIGKIILTYFEELFVFTLVTMFIYMYIQMSYDVNTAVRGEFFNLSLFLEGMFYLLPEISICTLLCTMFYLIRHDHSFGEFITGYLILCAFIWVLLVPLWHIKFPSFRYVVLFRDYEDAVVTQFLTIPPLFRYFVDRCTIIHQIAYIVAERGYLGWWIVSPFGLAISCLVCLTRISTWRLLNVFIIILSFIALVVSNSYFFDPRFLASIDLFSQLGYWVPFIFNILVSIVCICIAVTCRAFRRSNPNREDIL